MLSNLLQYLWDLFFQLVGAIGPIPLMLLAGVVYLGGSDQALEWIKAKWSGLKKPSPVSPDGPKDVVIDGVLQALQDMTAWCVRHGNPEILAKVTDLYKDIQSVRGGK